MSDQQAFTYWLVAAILAAVCPAVVTAAEPPEIPRADCLKVVWTTPSTNALGSMPLGNGDISVMAWAKKDGDLLLYVGKCDSWDENGRLLKLGRLRLHFSHNPFAAGQPFRQTLHADRAEIEIVSGESPRESRIRVWVDANRPVVRIETESDQEFELETRLEVWRTAERELAEDEDHCPIGKLSKDDRTKVTPDTILDVPNSLAWYHRNQRSVWAGTLKHQGLGELIPKYQDPLLALTSGCRCAETTCVSWTAQRCVRRRRAGDSWSACIRVRRRRLPPKIGWRGCESRPRHPIRSLSNKRASTTVPGGLCSGSEVTSLFRARRKRSGWARATTSRGFCRRAPAVAGFR